MRSSPKRVSDFFKEIGRKPSKVLSQNFLVDGNVVRKIVATADVKSGDFVLEIGPGFGALTEALVSAGAHVFVVEKDPAFRAELETLPVTLFMEDIRKFSFDSFPGIGKVVANLPYHITSTILIDIFEKAFDKFTGITVMVQEEMARRMVASPTLGDYGSLSVFLAFHADLKIAFKVSSSCFFPKPSVNSAVVHMVVKRKLPLEGDEKANFFRLTRTSFQQRRKMLVNSLESLYDKERTKNALIEMGKSLFVRAENLSLEDFLSLYRLLNP